MDKQSNYVSLLIDSLKKKQTLLDEIGLTNERLKQVLKDDRFDPEVFDAIGEEKRILVEEINKLDIGFETLYSRVKDELATNKDAYSTQIQTMQELIQSIVDAVTSIEVDEKRMKTEVEQQFSHIKQAVKQTRKNSAAVNNYYKSMQKLDFEPQFMDKKK